jgi:hypothetical protein
LPTPEARVLAPSPAAAAFTTPGDASVKGHAAGGKRWALKKNVPTATIPIKMANHLRVMHNQQNPCIAPGEAAILLRKIEEHEESLFVKHVMTADTIEAFFSSLKKKKKDGVAPELTRTVGSNGHRSFATVGAMRAECIRRLDLIHITKPKSMPSKKDEWALLLELSGLQRENALMQADEESQHQGGVKEAREEEDDGNVENAEGGEQQPLEVGLSTTTQCAAYSVNNHSAFNARCVNKIPHGISNKIFLSVSVLCGAGTVPALQDRL